ncbi:parkin coregulated gene protein homolog [Centruroides sculpturatus]|uniref:parkin coregulated gene protein homolog n=1 Tax=Centruroides sculpturatus TaxID=218467 RepID=UPI000C6DAA3A|nr:parkin coregulated gene protein homolog [Centruroides sculpturatus]
MELSKSTKKSLKKEYEVRDKSNTLMKEANPPIREVPAFTIESLQKNTKVTGPPLEKPLKVNVYKSLFRKRYETGEIPVFLYQESSGFSLKWLVNISDLDYRHYLPSFMEGLLELEHPYNLIAELGCKEMMNNGGEKIIHALPYAIPQINKALATRHPLILVRACRVIQSLALSEAGPFLVSAYPKLLPSLLLFLENIKNLGDGIDYGQRKGNCLGTLANETLQLLEKARGPDAYHHIKKVIPVYESCVHNY